jgi:hypothetical protein
MHEETTQHGAVVLAWSSLTAPEKPPTGAQEVPRLLVSAIIWIGYVGLVLLMALSVAESRTLIQSELPANP